ncbi:MAG: HAMP domain-containing histidine kinase [Clostridium sp.]|nr:HAMP domain-containing histidine kinase [Clostridium sp.]
MQWVDRIRQVKILLVVMAVMISVASLVISHILVKDLSDEERNKMEVWAEAMRTLNNADGETDLTLVLKVINGNNTIPVIVLDRSEDVLTYRNLDINASNRADSLSYVLRRAHRMKHAGDVIRLSLVPSDSTLVPEDYIDICFEESTMLKRLASYPYVQLGVVLIFVIVAIFALLSSKKAEQNKVWVGLSKETAHQLGTPISSLMAWVEILRESYPDDSLIPEMDKDVKRLQRIAERFSKIGSLPESRPENINEVVSRVAEYISRRASNKILLQTFLPVPALTVSLCAPLFEWVVENVCKNAIDAMNGCGQLTIRVFEESVRYVVEISDTGKGIPRNHFKSVFTPGFTTKKRGWGLGLSLAKRIVEEYHKGRIFVKSSELGKGTTFRIELKKY